MPITLKDLPQPKYIKKLLVNHPAKEKPVRKEKYLDGLYSKDYLNVYFSEKNKSWIYNYMSYFGTSINKLGKKEKHKKILEGDCIIPFNYNLCTTSSLWIST